MWGLWGLLYSPTGRDFFLWQSPHYSMSTQFAKHQQDLKVHFRTSFWFFEQLATTQGVTPPEFPTICFINLSGQHLHIFCCF